jgi:hypothetical protein
MKEMIKKVLNKTEHVGTHMYRKTGYLFAVWGARHLADEEGIRRLIQKSARHETDHISESYMQDAVTQLEISLVNDPECLRKTGKWKAILIQSTSNASFHTEFALFRVENIHVESKNFIMMFGFNPNDIDRNPTDQWNRRQAPDYLGSRHNC